VKEPFFQLLDKQPDFIRQESDTVFGLEGLVRRAFAEAASRRQG
jgi:hypothetical protein